MKIHEYQAKQLMAARGIAVPEGVAVTTVDEAVGATRSLIESTGNPVVVVKSQIHAGGRGKGRFKEYPEVAGVNVILDGIEGGESWPPRNGSGISPLECSAPPW